MRKWHLVTAALALSSIALAGCMVADSRIIDEQAEVGCHEGRGSALGSYYLPKSYFEVRVYRWRHPDTKDDFFKLQLEGTHTRADPSRLYCLNYLASPTAKDSVRAFKTEEGVLYKVAARAEDQTQEIIKKLLQTIFTLVIGFGSGPDSLGRAADDPSLSDVPWIEVFKAQYDPVDVEETAFINDRLKDFGFCLISQDLPEMQPTDPNSYCERPMHLTRPVEGRRHASPHVRTTGEPESGRRDARQDRPQHGIFYRPRLPYDIYLFARLDRKQKGRWSFRRKATIDIENHAPIISVGVDRTFFATRTTALEFDHGVLKDVRLYKSSELQQAVEIPIYIAQQLFALPTNIIRFRIDQFKNETTLKRAEAALLQAELARVNAGKNPSSLAADKAAAFRNYKLDNKGELPPPPGN